MRSTQTRVQDLLSESALVQDSMDTSRVLKIREEMERAEVRRLQPHYIESFFIESFRRLGGRVKEREPRRYQVTHVPAQVRDRDRLIGLGEPVLPRYERITFEKSLMSPSREATGGVRLSWTSSIGRHDRLDSGAASRSTPTKLNTGGRQ